MADYPATYYVVDLLMGSHEVEVYAYGPYDNEDQRDSTAERLAKEVGKDSIDRGIYTLLTATVDKHGLLSVGTYHQSEFDEWFAAPGVTENPKGS